jgi:hypothetical protein
MNHLSRPISFEQATALHGRLINAAAARHARILASLAHDLAASQPSNALGLQLIEIELQRLAITIETL